MWKDLAEDDVIYPAEGSEYVLKGSELIEGCAGKISTYVHPPLNTSILVFVYILQTWRKI